MNGAWLIGVIFAVVAIIFWGDESLRRLFLVTANIWWAAAYIRARLDP